MPETPSALPGLTNMELAPTIGGESGTHAAGGLCRFSGPGRALFSDGGTLCYYNHLLVIIGEVDR